MRAYALTNFDMDFNEKYFKLSFRTDTTFDELNAALEQFKLEIAKFKEESDKRVAEEIARKESEANANLESLEAAVEVLEPEVVA